MGMTLASQASIRTAYALYGGILDEVAKQDFDVFVRRAVVPNRRRAAVAARKLRLVGDSAMLDAIREAGVRSRSAEVEVGLAGMAQWPFADAGVL